MSVGLDSVILFCEVDILSSSDHIFILSGLLDSSILEEATMDTI